MNLLKLFQGSPTPPRLPSYADILRASGASESEILQAEDEARAGIGRFGGTTEQPAGDYGMTYRPEFGRRGTVDEAINEVPGNFLDATLLASGVGDIAGLARLGASGLRTGAGAVRTGAGSVLDALSGGSRVGTSFAEAPTRGAVSLGGGGRAARFKAEQMAARKAADVGTPPMDVDALMRSGQAGADDFLRAQAELPQATTYMPEVAPSIPPPSRPPQVPAMRPTVQPASEGAQALQALGGQGLTRRDILPVLRGGVRIAGPVAGAAGIYGVADGLSDWLTAGYDAASAPASTTAAPARQPERFPGTEPMDFGTVGTADIDPNIVLSLYENQPAQEAPASMAPSARTRDTSSARATASGIVSNKTAQGRAAVQQPKEESFGRKLLRSLAVGGLAYSGKLDPQSVLDKDYIDERRNRQRFEEAQQLTPEEQFNLQLAQGDMQRGDNFNDWLERQDIEQANARELMQMRAAARPDRIPAEVQMYLNAYNRGLPIDETGQEVLAAIGIPYDPAVAEQKRSGGNNNINDTLLLLEAIRSRGGSGVARPQLR